MQKLLARVHERSIQAKRAVSEEELLDFYLHTCDAAKLMPVPLEARYDCA
jgi:hypothetical protein